MESDMNTAVKNNTVFAKRIKMFREASGESQADLARLVGYEKQAVSHWENNGKVPRTPALEILAKHFQTSIDYLLGADTAQEEERAKVSAFSADEKRMIDIYRGLGKDEKVMILKILDAFGPRYEVESNQKKQP